MDDDKARWRSRTEVEKIEEYLFREATDWTREEGEETAVCYYTRPRTSQARPQVIIEYYENELERNEANRS
jgi:hypothetical protein